MSKKTYMDAIAAIVKSMEAYVSRRLSKASFDRTVEGVVTAVDGAKMTCTVQVDGKTHQIRVPSCPFSVGEKVEVLVPCNNWRRASVLGSELKHLNKSIHAKRAMEILTYHSNVSEGQLIPFDITKYTLLAGQFTLVGIMNIYFMVPVLTGYPASFSASYPNSPNYSIAATIIIEDTGMRISKLIYDKAFENREWTLYMFGIQ